MYPHRGWWPIAGFGILPKLEMPNSPDPDSDRLEEILDLRRLLVPQYFRTMDSVLPSTR